MIKLERRAAATQATMDRFKEKPFQWGRYDCGQMLKAHLLAMGRPVKAAKAGTYHSLAGSQKALRRLGYRNLVGLMDDHFQRIPPAAALLGDVIALEGEDGLDGITVALGNGRVLGYHADAITAVVLQPREYVAAWRVE